MTEVAKLKNKQKGRKSDSRAQCHASQGQGRMIELLSLGKWKRVLECGNEQTGSISLGDGFFLCMRLAELKVNYRMKYLGVVIVEWFYGCVYTRGKLGATTITNRIFLLHWIMFLIEGKSGIMKKILLAFVFFESLLLRWLFIF